MPSSRFFRSKSVVKSHQEAQESQQNASDQKPEMFLMENIFDRSRAYFAYHQGQVRLFLSILLGQSEYLKWAYALPQHHAGRCESYVPRTIINSKRREGHEVRQK